MIYEKFQVKIIPKEEFTNITESVQNVIYNAGLIDGLCIVYSPHTTACIRVLEDELLLRQDMHDFMERLASSNCKYRHDDIEKRSVPPDERLNGYSHLRAMLLNYQETIPVIKGKLDFGKWQSLFYIECDPGKQDRFYSVYLQGKTIRKTK